MATDTWSVDGFVKVDLTPNSGHVNCHSIDTGLTSTGSTAAGALALVSSINIVGTVAASTGVRLPAVVAPGALVDVINNSAGTITLSVYPPTGGKINGGSTDAADASAVAAPSSGVPGKQRYVQDGSLTGGVPNYLRIGT